MDASQWVWVLATGAILTGYVATWFAALKRAPATVVTSVLVLGAPITAVLDSIFKGTVPAALPLAGYGVIAAAVVVILYGAIKSRQLAPQPARP